MRVDGREVALQPGDEQRSLLEVLRLRAGTTSVKDGCSPQGQCGCCTVLVDGQPRVACVTAARRVADREVTTLDGLPEEVRRRFADALTATGGSQCGFCTPGIVVRLAALAPSATPAQVDDALLAHLCRCTGWQTIREAVLGAPPSGAPGERDLAAAAARATIEGGAAQAVGPEVALGRGGFAADTVPDGALWAVVDGAGGWAVGETLGEARAAAGRVQGRRTTLPLRWPIEPPAGAWDLTLATTWVEPAALEPDCSWCEPGGEPASPLANGGAFGSKVESPLPEAARRLAAEHGRPVAVQWTREDVVRHGAKRPPLAVGARSDGSGHVRVARTAGVAAAIAAVATGWLVEEVDIAGPPTSTALRAAGWGEVLAVQAALRGDAEVTTPAGAWARARVDEAGAVHVEVAAGPPLDEVVLRSYAIGAAHQALGLVRSEGIAVDEAGEPHDLTIRSFGVLRARDTPPVHVSIRTDVGPDRPVPGGDAVLAAVAAAAWLAEGLPPRWPARRS